MKLNHLVVVTHHRMIVQKSKALGLGLCVLKIRISNKFCLTRWEQYTYNNWQKLTIYSCDFNGVNDGHVPLMLKVKFFCKEHTAPPA